MQLTYVWCWSDYYLHLLRCQSHGIIVFLNFPLYFPSYLIPFLEQLDEFMGTIFNHYLSNTVWCLTKSEQTQRIWIAQILP